MCSSALGRPALGVLALCAVLAPCASAADTARVSGERVELTVEPRTCVSLHRGQTCFVAVRIDWSTPPATSDYCLYRRPSLTPLVCWPGATHERGTRRHDVASAEPVHFEIRRRDDDEPLAEVVVTTAWVYRTGKRSSSGWRLF